MTEEEIKQILKEINWDTPLSTDDYYRVFTGEVTNIKGLTKREIYIKLWKATYFHKLYRLLGDEKLKEAMDDEVLKGVFPQGFRNRLFNAKRILYS